MIETHVIVSQKLINNNEFLVWHDRLGHSCNIPKEYYFEINIEE